MFMEYLHPELVLFGAFLEPNKPSPQPIERLDGEIIVHQQINRRPKQSDKAKEISRLMEQLQQFRLDTDEDEEKYAKQHYRDQEDGEWNEGEEQDDEVEEEGEEEDPYGEEYYGYGAEEQYTPQQLAMLFSQRSAENSPQKTQKIPLATKSPQPVKEEDEDDGWVTEQQEQEYVTMQMMEQAGGNFQGDLGEM